MSEFRRLQDAFQSGVMGGDPAILADILDSPRERRDILFGVYQYAYGSRLVEALRSDHPLLHAYVGDEMFDEMGKAYVAATPSQHPNMRWYAAKLPAFLRAHEPYCAYPILADLAALEKMLGDAFDAADAPVLALGDLARFAPEQWAQMQFKPHPGATRLDAVTNVAAIWLALKDDETPPDAETLDPPAKLVAWRQDATPMFRELPTEEAMMWDEMANGIPFGVLCSMLATYDDPDGAAARGAGYLHGWITAGMLSSVTADE